MAGSASKGRGMRLVNRFRLRTIRDVVRTVRAGFDLSPNMRLVADEIAVEILAENHGIRTSVRRVARIAS